MMFPCIYLYHDHVNQPVRASRTEQNGEDRQYLLLVHAKTGRKDAQCVHGMRNETAQGVDRSQEDIEAGL
jgi:hypothetical protein